MIHVDIKNWVGGTKEDYIRGYKTVETIGRIDCKDIDCSEPSEVEDILKIRAVQKGGNGFVKLYWEKHTNRHTTTFPVGNDSKGNPNFHSISIDNKRFTGYATAIIAEPN